MTDAVYVYSGYALTVAVLAAYTGWIISRTRSLRRRIRPAWHERGDQHERRP